MKTTRIGLIGFGTIGTGVAKLLLQEHDRLAVATQQHLVLAKICDKDLQTVRDIDLPADVLTDDVEHILNDPHIDIVVELVGGLSPAKDFVLRALRGGKNVVTANKALLATHGTELFETARQFGKTIAFEAAVCGGIPILTALSTSLQANRILSIRGIVNGTSNYILSRMAETGLDYNLAVIEAQRLGFAETNPAMDVDGTDAAQKLTILAQLGFGVQVDWRQISRTGIESVCGEDISYAAAFGYRIRLLAVADNTAGELELHVSPSLVRQNTVLADTSGATNAVEVIGSAVGPVVFQGAGAGQMPTASAVVGDIVDTILGRAAITAKTIRFWALPQSDGSGDTNKKEKRTEISAPMVKMKSATEFSGESYLRCTVADQPGVLAEIAGILGTNGISIASMIQRQPDVTAMTTSPPAKLSTPQAVSLMLTTHTATDGQLETAISRIDRLPCVKAPTFRMRVVD